MAAERGKADAEYGPWNPGIQSELPPRLVPLSTIFRPANVFTSVAQAAELSGLTGLPLEELAVFRPERLVVHELLIRVTADISVPDPEAAQIDDLGINFRHIARTIYSDYIEPHLPEIAALYASLQQALAGVIATELAVMCPSTAAAAKTAPTGRWGCVAGSTASADAATHRRSATSRGNTRSARCSPGRPGRPRAAIPCAEPPVMRCPGLSPRFVPGTAAGGGTRISSALLPPVWRAMSIAAERSVASSSP